MSQNILHTFLNETELQYIKSADGIKIVMESGETYFDFTAGITEHAILGWSNPEIVKSITNQASKVPHIDFKTFGDRGRDKLAELLISAGKHKLDRVYFSGNSGGEACEAAMKLSYQYFYDTGRPEKTWFIGREQSYHGSSSDCLSLNDRPNLLFYAPHFPRNRAKIPEHNIYRNKGKYESICDYENRSVRYLEDKILEIGPEKVAGFIGETIQGGLVGAVPPTKNYWKKIRELCDNYDIHLIIDEVWCGTGTSGRYYCIDWDEVTPDFLFMGKTVTGGYAPLSLVLTSSSKEHAYREGQGRIQHSTTHQGHSIAVAAAVAAQTIIQSPGFLDQVNEKGEFIRDYLQRELGGHPYFRNIRGRGLRLAMEFECQKQQNFCKILEEQLLKKRNVLMSVKWHRASFTPALTSSLDEIEYVLKSFVTEFKDQSINNK